MYGYSVVNIVLWLKFLARLNELSILVKEFIL